MSKEKFSDERWHNGTLESAGNTPELGLSEQEKARRRNQLNQATIHFLGRPMSEEEIPNNLRPTEK